MNRLSEIISSYGHCNESGKECQYNNQGELHFFRKGDGCPGIVPVGCLLSGRSLKRGLTGSWCAADQRAGTSAAIPGGRWDGPERCFHQKTPRIPSIPCPSGNRTSGTIARASGCARERPSCDCFFRDFVPNFFSSSIYPLNKKLPCFLQDSFTFNYRKETIWQTSRLLHLF